MYSRISLRPPSLTQPTHTPVDLCGRQELAEVCLARRAWLEVAALAHITARTGGGNVGDARKLLVQAASAEVVA